MTPEELLINLQDIDAPPEPGWWLLPPAVWMLLIAVALGVGAVWFYRRYRDRKRLTDLAAGDLLRIETEFAHHRDNRRLALDLSRWLRQVAVQVFTARRVAALTGRDWLEFLDRVADTNQFRQGAGQVFAEDVFRPRTEIDAQASLLVCRQWLQQIRAHARHRRREPC